MRTTYTVIKTDGGVLGPAPDGFILVVQTRMGLRLDYVTLLWRKAKCKRDRI